MYMKNDSTAVWFGHDFRAPNYTRGGKGEVWFVKLVEKQGRKQRALTYEQLFRAFK